MADARDLTLAEQVGLLSGASEWETRGVPRLGVRAVVVSDGPHGLVHGEPATCFPPAVTLAATWDAALLRDVGRALGREAAAQGVHVVLGPGLNIKRHPRCGRNFEYFSEDPLLSGHLAAALVEGLQGEGVGACAKHFAVNNQEAHRFVVDAVVDERTLRELYLAGFEHVVRVARPWAVMASYNLVNGVGATEHRHLLTEVLRDEWGFDGLVVSDWAATRDRAVGVRAGLDLEMPGNRGVSDGHVRRAVARGDLVRADVTRAAQRVLDLAARAGAAAPTTPTPMADLVDPHDALARRAAAAGTVLLTNNGVLPLRRDATVALLGDFADAPRYQGAGSSRVVPTRLTTARDAFRAVGVRLVDDPAAADVAVVLAGLPAVHESEGFDRDDLALPPDHTALVAATVAQNPTTVVCLANGAPVLTPWAADVAAVVATHLGGQAGGGALVDVLLGDAEPAGRLAETWPVAASDLAADPFFPGRPRQVEHRESLFVGHRHLTTAGIAPAFAFGHGLSYTSFAWGEPTLDRSELTPADGVRVSLTVTNTGTRAGSDVVQVYLHDRTGVVLRPRRWLAGFAKVHLAPGASEVVVVDVPARAFAFWEVGVHDWRTPTGAFDIEVARSSVDVVATRTLHVTGGVTTASEPADTPPVATDDAAFARRLGRPVPTPRPTRPFTRESTVTDIAHTPIGRLVRALAVRTGLAREGPDPDEVVVRMVARSVDEMPLRALAGWGGGLVRWPMVDAVVRLANLPKLRRPG